MPSPSTYRGRIAPSPTGYLHLGHALTFWTAHQRAQAAAGTLILRIEDLDSPRCRPEFLAAIPADLHWFGINWHEGPDIGGPHAPYLQSQRDYLPIWRALRDSGHIYPCACSRRDVLNALSAPHGEETQNNDPIDYEPLYPGTCRHRLSDASAFSDPAGLNWRFKVPDGEQIHFHDTRLGPQSATAARDFGDFLVWRKDNIPSYQLAVVADDSAMSITEVVRGEDLLKSTFRQLLLYQALNLTPPAFHHCPLIRDPAGHRLAKRHPTLTLRDLKTKHPNPADLRPPATGV
jgi:glutamyl-tRNA synthetase